VPPQHSLQIHCRLYGQFANEAKLRELLNALWISFENRSFSQRIHLFTVKSINLLRSRFDFLFLVGLIAPLILSDKSRPRSRDFSQSPPPKFFLQLVFIFQFQLFCIGSGLKPIGHAFRIRLVSKVLPCVLLTKDRRTRAPAYAQFFHPKRFKQLAFDIAYFFEAPQNTVGWWPRFSAAFTSVCSSGQLVETIAGAVHTQQGLFPDILSGTIQ